MIAKKKNKRILTISIIAVAVVAVFVSALFFAFRPSGGTKSIADCENIISEVHSKGSQDPLYEPPVQYFECIEAR